MLRLLTMLTYRCVLLSTVLGAVSAAALASTSADAFDKAVNLYNQKNYAQAAAAFEALIAKDPGNANASYYAGLSYQGCGNANRAALMYARTVQYFPNTQAGRLAAALLPKSPSGSLSNSPATVGSATANPGRFVDSQLANRAIASDLASLPERDDVTFTGENNEIVVPVEINGKSLPMVLDTGAGTVFVGKNQLEQYGINISTKGPATMHGGGASNGGTVDEWVVPADVKLGHILRKNFPIVVAENNAAAPLLGQAFLRDFQSTFDYGAHRVFFTKKAFTGQSGRSKATVGVPFEWWSADKTKMLLKAELNGRPCDVCFDTGNAASAVTLNRAMADQLRINIPPDASQRVHVGVTGSGLAYVFPISHIRLGPIDKSNIEISVNDGPSPPIPLLGQDFFKDYQFTIDYENKTINFLRR